MYSNGWNQEEEMAERQERLKLKFDIRIFVFIRIVG